MMLTGFSGVAMAATDFVGCPTPPCSGAPNPVTNGTGFSRQIAQSAYANGSMPQISLAGDWKMVGAVSAQDAYDLDGHAIQPGYNLDGFKNADGSLSALLGIQMGGATGETDFAGNPIINPSTVTLYNLGKSDLNQGPNELMFDLSAKAACFAQYAFNNGESLSKSHYNYQCRMVRNAPNKLICEIRLFLAAGEDSNDKRFDRQLVAYFAFMK